MANRYLFCILIFLGVMLPASLYAQCTGLPSVTSLGSNKLPNGLCAPVDVNVAYSIGFASAVAPGELQIIYDWGDGSTPEIVSLSPGSKLYNVSRSHRYPAESDCEYFVTMAVRYNGRLCTNTLQLQKVSSWRTDAFNGGNVQLISPTSKNSVHLVCEGEDISVVFSDKTNWNCNTQGLLSGDNAIESPNTEYRWQQIVYNMPVEGNKIPNVSVDGVRVTGNDGVDILPQYQDPRGVFFMSAPVLVDDARRRPSLKITAPGGFGSAFPGAGDVFAITLRYWNFCNPYDDPEIPGPPSDLINGDHAPVEETALIQVVAPSPAPTAVDQSVCFGKTPSAFSVTGVLAGNVVNWYRYVPGSDEAGVLISSSTKATLPVTSHPDWKGNTTPGVFKVWAAQRSNTADGTNCESPKVLVTRIIRENLVIPEPDNAVPTEICNGESFTVTMPPPATESAGGQTRYTWTASGGIKVGASDASSAVFSANVADFGSALFVDGVITTGRQYANTPSCPVGQTYKVRIYQRPVGGTLSGPTQACESAPLGTISLTGFKGTILRWEVKKDSDEFTPYTGGNSISPGKLPPGAYIFRAVVGNGPCGEVYSNELRVDVSRDPGQAFAGSDQFICNAIQSAGLNANVPAVGTGTWTYVSSVPANLPAPAFDPHDPNTQVVIEADRAGVYVMRWTFSNGSCKSSDDVIIDFGTNPTDPDAGPDRTVCGSSTTLQANTPDKGQGSWTIVSGPDGCAGGCGITIASPLSASSPVELTGAAPLYGQYTFRWSISSGGNNCFLETDDVVITFEEPVTADAHDVTNVCLDKDNPEPITVSGEVSGPVKFVRWEIVNGAGTLSSTVTRENGDAVTAQAVYQPTAADYNATDIIQLKLVAEPRSASCAPVEKTISVYVEKKPIAVAGTDINNICEDFVALRAETPQPGAKGIWHTTAPGVTFDDLNDPNTTVRNLPVGVTMVTWTVARDAGCASHPASVRLTRVAKPVANDFSSTECAADDGGAVIILERYEDNITSAQASERTITWYRGEALPGNIVMDSSVPQSGVVDGEKFTAQILDINTNCSSEATATFHVRPLPQVAGAVISQCEDVAGSNMISGIDLTERRFSSAITSESNVDVVWYNSESDAKSDRFPIVKPVMVNKQGAFFARVTYRDTPFCFAIARLNIVVNPQPAITNIIGRASVCQGVPSTRGLDDLPVHIYQVTPIPGAKYHWEIPDDATTQFKVFAGGGERDFYVMLQFPNIYTGKIAVRGEMNGCSGPLIEKEITVSATPPKPLIEGTSVVCENDNYVSFSVLPNNYPSSVYNWEIRRVSDNSTGAAHIMEGQLTGNILVNFGDEDVIVSVRESSAECVSPVATKVIKVTDPPKATLSVQREISCFMANDGVIKTEVAGGTAPFTGFEIVESGLKDPDSDGIFEQLPQGSYTVRLTDANGCVATSDTKVLRQPAPLVIDRIHVPFDASGFNVSCPDARDGEIHVSISGGNDAGDYTTSLFKYNSTAPVIVREGKGSVVFSDVDAGTYSISVEDGLGCASLPGIAFVVSPPALYGGAIGPDQVICSGDDPKPITELAAAKGGSGVYEYEWQESSTGDVYNDAAWTVIPGQNDVTFDPPPLTTRNPLGEQRYYRRIVRSISTFSSDRQICEEKGKTERVTITINPTPEVEFMSRAEEICEGDVLAIDLTLTSGRPPMTFDYAVSSATFGDQRGPGHTVITVPDIRTSATVSLLRLTDANGCVPEHLPAPVNASVISFDPAFSVNNERKECDGGTYSFTWNATEDIGYRWEWGDGTMTELPAGAVENGPNTLIHSFRAQSGSKATQYEVKLFASHEKCMEKVTSHTVSVSPAMRLNVHSTDTLLCSGEPITFYNNSVGVGESRWYYRDPVNGRQVTGKMQEQDHLAFSFENTTSDNPLIYEVVYEAESVTGCRDEFRQKVYVFRSNTASFDIASVPSFEGAQVSVHVNNTSEVVDEGQFAYHWTYGERGVVEGPSSLQSFNIDYYSPGVKDIRLNIVNIAARALGKSCESSYVRRIDIPVSGLDASFTAGPFASCAPSILKIENTSRGADAFEWKLFRGDTLVSTSNLRYPEFRITGAGIYNIALVASVTSTGQRDEAIVKGIEVFDAPKASFEIRSDLIYVPDTEIEVMNFSVGANLFRWEFGDGHSSDAFEPSHAFERAGTYPVVLWAGYDHGMKDTDGDGEKDDALVCYDTARRTVTALNGGTMRIPNAFTPGTRGQGRGGGDGINDVFLPVTDGVTDFHMQIYDRWGTLVFESRSKESGWDGYDRNGRLLPAGVYVYKIVVRTSEGENATRAGDVTLIR